jgi:hypothetical protein
MHKLIEIGVQILEWMFGVGLVVSCLAMVLGLIDDIKTFIKY